MGLTVTNPTYLLAPNWTFKPDGPIALGNIITNPLKPHIVLTKADSALQQLETTIAVERNVNLVDEGSRNLSLSLWATFLETIKFSLGAEHGKKLRTEYAIETLETIYFRDGITQELVQERAKDPIIRALMNPDSILSKPVFMITGVKVAKGFRLSSESSSTHEGILGATALTGTPVSAGGEGKAGGGNMQAYGFDSDNVVFAYQLLKIAPKGWGKNRAVYGTEYESTGVFLGDDGGDDGEVQFELEFSHFATADLSDLDLNPDHVVDEKRGTIADGNQEYLVLSQKTEDEKGTNANNKEEFPTTSSKKQ